MCSSNECKSSAPIRSIHALPAYLVMARVRSSKTDRKAALEVAAWLFALILAVHMMKSFAVKLSAMANPLGWAIFCMGMVLALAWCSFSSGVWYIYTPGAFNIVKNPAFCLHNKPTTLVNSLPMHTSFAHEEGTLEKVVVQHHVNNNSQPALQFTRLQMEMRHTYVRKVAENQELFSNAPTFNKDMARFLMHLDFGECFIQVRPLHI